MEVNKYYDKELGSPMLELSVAPELAQLLEEFCVKDMSLKPVEGFLTKPFDREVAEETGDGTRHYVERYRIRTSLIGTLNNDYGWYNFYDLLFTPEIINDHKVKVVLTTESTFNEIERKVNQIKYLVEAAEKLLAPRKINITLNLEDE